MADGPHAEIISPYFQHMRLAWPVVWERPDSSVLDPSAREFLFMIINNIVPNRARLYLKMNLVDNPCCTGNIRQCPTLNRVLSGSGGLVLGQIKSSA